MPHFAIYDAKGNIQKLVGGTPEQCGSGFVAANTPAGLQSLQVGAADLAVLSDPSSWQVIGQKFVRKPAT